MWGGSNLPCSLQRLGSVTSMVTARLSPVAGGLAAFRAFLRSEHSEENVEFWLRCEEYKRTRSPSKLRPKAMKIYEEFISVQATQEVGAPRSLVAGRSLGVAFGPRPCSPLTHKKEPCTHY